MVHPNDDFLSAPELDYEGFRAALREDWGWFSPALQTNIFVGKVRTRRVSGFVATDLTCNATRIERTELDIRRNQQAHGLMSDWPNYPAGAADGRDLGHSPLTDVAIVAKRRPSRRMRFKCADRISIFLRSRRDCSKPSAQGTTGQRLGYACGCRAGILRDGSFGQHCGLSRHTSQSSLLARYRRVLPLPRREQ
jgi:hypothetical protein